MTDTIPAFPRLIASPEDLAEKEAIALDDIGFAFHAHLGTSTAHSFNNITMKLVKGVFNTWNTSMVVPEPWPHPGMPHGDATRLQIGTFSQDLPEPPVQESEHKRPKLTKVSTGPYDPMQHRKAGDPVYFRPILNASTFLPSYHAVDALDRLVDLKYISFSDCFKAEPCAFAAAAAHYDKNERDRVGIFNARWAIYWMRKRLRYWAQHPEHSPRRDPRSTEDFSVLQAPLLNVDRVPLWQRTIDILRDTTPAYYQI